jgi:hypothetical protein
MIVCLIDGQPRLSKWVHAVFCGMCAVDRRGESTSAGITSMTLGRAIRDEVPGAPEAFKVTGIDGFLPHWSMGRGYALKRVPERRLPKGCLQKQNMNGGLP